MCAQVHYWAALAHHRPRAALKGMGCSAGRWERPHGTTESSHVKVVVVQDPTNISYQVYEATHELHHNATNNPYVGKQQNLITMSTLVTPQRLHMRLPLNL